MACSGAGINLVRFRLDGAQTTQPSLMPIFSRKPRSSGYHRAPLCAKSLRRCYPRPISCSRRERAAARRNCTLLQPSAVGFIHVLSLWQDLDKDDQVPETFQPASLEQVFEIHKQEQAVKKRQEKAKQRKLAAFGFEGEHSGEAIL